MEKLPLSSTQNKRLVSYDATKMEEATTRLKEIPENVEENCISSGTEYDTSLFAKLKRKKWKRRQSSEGAFIHITGTGTLCEETLNCKDCYKGNYSGLSYLKIVINIVKTDVYKSYFF